MGLNRAQLCKEIKSRYDVDISPDSIANYETIEPEYNAKSGKNNGMSVKYLRVLADFFGVSSDYLIGISEISSPNPTAQAACEYTGLTEANIEELHRMKEGRDILGLYDYEKFMTNVMGEQLYLECANDILGFLHENTDLLAQYFLMRHSASKIKNPGYIVDPTDEMVTMFETLESFGWEAEKCQTMVVFHSREMGNMISHFFNEKYGKRGYIGGTGVESDGNN